MAYLLKPAPHLTLPKVEKQYKGATNSVERVRLLIIKLLLEGKRCPEVSSLVGFTVDYVRRVVRKYNKEGGIGLKDKRTTNGGNRFVLNEEQRARLAVLIEKESPPDGGFWTSPKIRIWVEKETGKTISEVSAWKYLKRLGFSILVPRPHHVKANLESQEEFKKKDTAGSYS